jgi:glucose/mannose transport system substrate-binding protein
MSPNNLSRRQFIRLSGMAAGAGLALAACGPAPAPAPAAGSGAAAVEPTKAAAARRVATMGVIPGPPAKLWTQAAEDYKAVVSDFEVKINVAGGGETEWKPNFPQIAMSNDKPDIAWYWVDGRQYQDLVAAGALEPLDDLYEKEGWTKVFPESVLKNFTSPDGHKYAVTNEVNVYPIVYYNKEQFASAGVEPPKNGVYYESLDEWYAVCDKLRAAGLEPLTVGSKEGWRIGHCHDVLLQRMVPQALLDDFYNNWRPGWDVKARYNGPEWQSADKMLKEWQDKGVFAEGDLGRNYAEGRALFVQKKAAMYQDGVWAIDILKNEAPDMKIGWFLYPQVLPEIKPKFLLYAGSSVMLLKGTPHLEDLKKFLAWHYTPERQLWQVGFTGTVTPRTDLGDKLYEVMDPMLKDVWIRMGELGTSTGWDDPAPADMAEKSFILFQEMLTDARAPESVGEELEKMAEAHRQK